jgi:hypothetical protein
MGSVDEYEPFYADTTNVNLDIPVKVGNPESSQPVASVTEGGPPVRGATPTGTIVTKELEPRLGVTFGLPPATPAGHQARSSLPRSGHRQWI